MRAAEATDPAAGSNDGNNEAAEAGNTAPGQQMAVMRAFEMGRRAGCCEERFGLRRGVVSVYLNVWSLLRGSALWNPDEWYPSGPGSPHLECLVIAEAAAILDEERGRA